MSSHLANPPLSEDCEGWAGSAGSPEERISGSWISLPDHRTLRVCCNKASGIFFAIANRFLGKKTQLSSPSGLTLWLCQEICYIKAGGNHAGRDTSPCSASSGELLHSHISAEKQLVLPGFPQFLFLAVPFCRFAQQRLGSDPRPTRTCPRRR